MRKREIPEVLLRSVMSLYDGAETWVKVDSDLSKEFEVKMWMHQGSVMDVALDAVTGRPKLHRCIL